MLDLSKIERKAWLALNKYVLFYLPRTYQPSSEPCTLVMPLAVKDLAHAQATLDAWTKHLQHPLAEIVVVGQDDRRIAHFAARCGARYINEEDVLSPAVKSFGYVYQGRSRNGWIRQQILKLMADTFTHSKDILVADSDTHPVRPISFRRNGRPILFVTHDFTPTYYACMQRLLPDLTLYRRSFVAHCMLFERGVLQQLRSELEQHAGRPWDEAILNAIDKSVDASFSEFELYGNYVYNRMPHLFAPEYWFNCRLRQTDPGQALGVQAGHARYNFISRHIHLHASE